MSSGSHFYACFFHSDLLGSVGRWDQCPCCPLLVSNVNSSFPFFTLSPLLASPLHSYYHHLLLQLSCFSYVQLFVTPWTVARLTFLSIGFFRQEYWSGFHALLQGILLTQGLNLHLLPSPALTGGFFTTSATWEALLSSTDVQSSIFHFMQYFRCLLTDSLFSQVLVFLLMPPTSM